MITRWLSLSRLEDDFKAYPIIGKERLNLPVVFLLIDDFTLVQL